MPQDGQLINDIEKAWQGLENAEYHREVALREELLRQEKLEQLNYKFEKKSVLREGYLKEMIQVLSDPRYGASFAQVDATVKKHEAISADILARVERFNDLTSMAEELDKENYHGKDRVKRRESEVLEKWRKLLELLEHHKNNLAQMSNLMSLLREIDATLLSIYELKVCWSMAPSKLSLNSISIIIISNLIIADSICIRRCWTTFAWCRGAGTSSLVARAPNEFVGRNSTPIHSSRSIHQTFEPKRLEAIGEKS